MTLSIDTPSEPQNQAGTLERILDIAYAFRQSFALLAAAEHDIFTSIAEGADTADALARSRSISPRGARILCDFLVTTGLLVKHENRYACSPDAEKFLNRNSPESIASSIAFLVNPDYVNYAAGAAESVRSGGMRKVAAAETSNTGLWRHYADTMAPYMRAAAKSVASAAQIEDHAAPKILDVAAGHGEFGLAIASLNPRAQIYALDFPEILPVARERFKRAGLEPCFNALPGDAFEISPGSGYDVIVLANFLHFFDEKTNIKLLKKLAGALRQGGKFIVVDFIPDESRVQPAIAARFAFLMLVSTESGDAYTFADLTRTFSSVGFDDCRLQDIPSSPLRLFISGPARLG